MRAEDRRTPVTVVICCYTLDRWTDLCAAVEQVSRQRRDGDDLVICVDHNPQLFHRATVRFGHATVLENHHAPGLSGARNCAVARATGAAVVFLDDDAVPASGWLESLVAPFADPNVYAVGGAAEPRWPRNRPGWFPAEFDWVVGCSYRGLPVGRAPIRNVMGCNMAFRRSVFDVGLDFEPSMGRNATGADGCEETDLCIRIRRTWPEAEIVFEPAASVRHRVPAQRCSWRYFLRRCYAEGRSKARMAALLGVPDSLRSEWSYTRRVLPGAVVRGLGEAVLGERAGLARSAAILAGLGVTTFGYAQGRYLP